MEKKKLLRIILTAVLLVGAVIIEKTLNLEVWQLLLVYLVPFLLIGYDTIGEAVEGIMHGEVFDEDFLMCVATVGALLIGFLPGAETEFPEAVFVMLFFQIGELFEHYAEDNSRKSISHLMDIRPDSANVERGGQVVEVSPEQVAVGETIVVKPGEKLPLDGVVVEGETSLNTVALTGESMPRSVKKGDEVVSGCINISGVVRIRVEKSFGESTVSKILDLVEHASGNKSKSETFIARFARVYTPIVVYVALALAFIPPFFCGGYMEALPVWVSRALTFLVVSCPCALVISVPLTFFAGIGGASRRGILIKGSNYMDTLAKTATVVFDKTGTLTKGRFEVEAVHPQNFDERELLHLAAHVERYSTHPIAMSLKTAFGNESDGCRVENVEEIAGQGIRALVNGKEVCVGNARMMDAIGAEWHECHRKGTIVHVAADGVYAGHIVVNDVVKDDAQEAVEGLKRRGIRKTVMLTGDHQDVALRVAEAVGIDECHAGLLPADKVDAVEKLIDEKKEGEALAFVGDGINDAPVLARADVGIAMGALGSDAAIEAADVVLMDDKPSKIATAIGIARRTIGIARENVVFAIFIKLLVLVLAAFGVATMWMAVFADVGVTVIAVFNAMRALNTARA
ncbi:heavy metal translocating P-type ATPase [uncultured Prevotella sp.]|uniref:heavy metal translocating P-type ATPase n=1 Tax=uncultured Prevotella sp. TaxID=159272 RepID=UPI00262707CC|nr:heavy metal translocating P-type ATPase [uncultured Prevotella sp.]